MALNSYFLYLSIVIVLCILVNSKGVSGCKNCTSTDIVSVQNLCHNENNELVTEQRLFENHNNKTKFCGVLFDFFFCVGRKVPECISTISSMYASYYSTPYDCHPDPKTTEKLQEYARSVVCGTTGSTTKPSTEMTSFIIHVTSNHAGNTGTNTAHSSTKIDFTVFSVLTLHILYTVLRTAHR